MVSPTLDAPAEESVKPNLTAKVSAAAISWLDRPVASFLRLNWETAIWIAIFVVGAVARFVMLDVRAMSHDESLHSLYSYYLYANGNYDHNPMMHGPFRYHVSAFFYFLFGDSDFTARLGPAVMGMGVIGMVYLLRPYIGRLGAIFAGIMVTISPSLLFHSRYIRDDIFMAFFTLVWIYGAFRYLDTRRMRYLTIMVAGMAFGFATMENHFIHGAIIGSFFLALALWQVAGANWVIGVVAPFAVGGGAWWVLHEQKMDSVALVAVAIGAVASLVVLVLALRNGRWHKLRRNDAADLVVVMVTMVLPFMAAFLHVFTGGDPQVFSDAAKYTTQEMIVRLTIFVAICVLASVAIGVFWFWGRSKQAVVGSDGAGGDGAAPAVAPDDAAITDSIDEARWRPGLGQWAMLMGFFWIVQVLFFTTFFTNLPNGLATGVVGSLGYWIAQQGVKRGGQPVYYYVLIGWLYEFLPAFLALCGLGTVFYKLFRTPAGERWDPVVAGDVPRSSPRLDNPVDVAAGEPDTARSNRRADNRVHFAVFAVWWTVGAWVGYSVAGEKMPWLLTHMALPMCVLGGWWLGSVVYKVDWRDAWRDRTWLLVFVPPVLFVLMLVVLVATAPGAGLESDTARRVLQWGVIVAAFAATAFLAAFGLMRSGAKRGLRLLAIGLAGVLLLLTIRTTYMLNYINFDSATEYLVYAHATPDVKRALSEIDTISQRTVGDRNITVAYDDESSWPLSWYMRQYPNAKYYGANPTPDAMAAPVVIVGPANREKVQPYVARDYVKRTYRMIWWPEMDYFNLTWDRLLGAITDPAQRDRLFNIIAFRKYRDPNDLTKWRDLSQWPFRHEFDMYVRRDLAPMIWDLNVTPLADQAVSNVPVVGPEQIRSVQAAQVFNQPYNNLPLSSPRAVAVGPNGERVIADTGNHRIVVLDANGNFVRTFGSYCRLDDQAKNPCKDPDGAGPLAAGDGQFFEPWGVAVDGLGNIYVADTWNGRIQVFKPDGTFINKWGMFAVSNEANPDPNALFGPRGLTFDLDGNLVVADTGNKRIVRYRPTSEFVDQVGGGGVVAGRFEEPTDVTVDPTDGSLLVADAWNGRVQRLGSDLKPAGEFPVPGWTGREVAQKPYLAVTSDGTIYTTDPASGLIVGYDRNGKVLVAFGGAGAGPNQTQNPTGIAADLTKGTLVVADGGNNRVLVFPAVK